MTTYFGKELFIRFTASAFRKLSSIHVLSYFPFGFEGRMWDLIVSVPDHCLSFYFKKHVRTSDHMFVLKSLINKYINKSGGRLYTCFVDFRKAFDTVIHTGLKSS